MTDQKMLEKAARAAGYIVGPIAGGPANELHRWSEEEGDPYSSYCGIWNPLEDDGDAFRIAVLCQMDVSFGMGGGGAYPKDGDIRIEIDKEDPEKAIRRAIVRAAAAMEDGT